MLLGLNAEREKGKSGGEKEKSTVEEIMWIIIPGQRLDEQGTLTHQVLKQPRTPTKEGRQRSRAGGGWLENLNHWLNCCRGPWDYFGLWPLTCKQSAPKI